MAGLTVEEILAPHRDQIPDHPGRSELLSNYATPALNNKNNNNDNKNNSNFLSMAGQPLVDQALVIVEASQSHKVTNTQICRTPLDE
jgi:hypothetical protein